MRILITGGAGFIGQHLARALTGDATLVGLDSVHPQVHADPKASVSQFPGQIVCGNVGDARVWRELGRFDAVVHLAAETGTAQSMYEEARYRQANVEGTRLAARAARVWGARFVFLSSRAVYGEGRYRSPDGTVTFGARPSAGATAEPSQETDLHVPVSVYGQTKSEAERFAAEVAVDVPVTIIRPQNVIGLGQALHNPYTGVLAAFLARLRNRQPLLVYGDGHETRDFVHVSDVVRQIRWALTLDAPRLTTVNCGSGHRTTLLQLATHAVEASPVGGSIEHVEVKRAGDIEHACADLSHGAVVGAPGPMVRTVDAVTEFIRGSWDAPPVDTRVWDLALNELRGRGLAQ